jgi:hypothetical protein
VSMHYFKLFVPSLLAALGLPLSVIAALCNGQNQPMVAAAWYEGWAADTITPGSLPYNKLNLITFAFALVSFHFSIASLLI